MDPLDPTSRGYATSDLSDADHPTARLPPGVRALPELPDPHVDSALLMRAVRAATTQMRARAPDVVNTDKPARDVAIQRKLDDCRDEATPTYRTPQGDVNVAAPFRTAKDPAIDLDDGVPAGILAQREHRVDANRATLMKVAASIGIEPRIVLLVQHGRGSANDVRRLTQALIDQGRLPETVLSPGQPPRVSTDPLSRVQAMMADHGIGLDGPGYARQAVAASGGSSRVASAPVVGEVVALPSGERGVLYDRREATDEEKAELARTAGLAPGRVTAWVVDGVWRPHWSDKAVDFVGGGLQRATWLHDEASGKWALRGPP